MALTRLESEASDIEQGLQRNDIHKLTRTRLIHLRDARTDQRRRLGELLAPLGAGSPAAKETYLALRTRLPPDQGTNTYFGNLHRDWCWGDEENRLSCDFVASQLAEAPQRLLIIGAGAGRLACDLHLATGAEQTIALDFNPLLLLTLKRLLAG